MNVLPQRFYICLYLILVSNSMLICQAQEIRDSFELVIEAEKDDSLKVMHILRYIRNGGLNNESDILVKTSQAINLAKKLNSDSLLMSSYVTSGEQLSAIPNGISTAKDTYFKLKKIASSISNTNFMSRANIGLADLFAKEGDVDEAKKLLLESLQLLKPTEHIELKAVCYNQLSFIYRDQGQFEEANAVLDSTIILLRNDSLSTQLFSALSSKGRIYRFLGENERAKDYYKRAEKVAIANKHRKNLAVIYNNLGNIDHMGGRYDKALEYYYNSIKIKEEFGDFKGLCIGYHNVGAIYIDMKDWDKALKNFELSNTMAEDIDFKVLLVHTNNKIGDVYVELERFDDALVKHNAAQGFAEQSDFKNGVTNSLYKIGNVYLQKEEYAKSNEFLLKALKIARSIKSKPLESATLVAIAENYIKSSEVNKGFDLENNGPKDSEILEYLLSAKSLSDEMNNVENQLKSLEGLNLFYSTTGNHKENVVVLKEYLALKDTIFTKDRIEAIADWETKYETAQKEKEILELESQNRIAAIKRKQANYMTITGGFLFFSLVGLGYYFLLQANRRKLLNQRERFRSKLSSDLHDDVGTILTGLAMQTELLSNFVPDNIKPNVESIASMGRDAMGKMRDTVWAIDSRKDTVDDLVHRMIDFAEENLITKEIELKFNSNLKEKDLKIEPVIRQNLYLIFKEAIINILKHSNADLVNVQLTSSKSNLEFSIHDNGTFDKDKIKTSGTGTSNIKMRVKNLNGRLDIDTSNGYSISLSVPLKK